VGREAVPAAGDAVGRKDRSQLTSNRGQIPPFGKIGEGKRNRRRKEEGVPVRGWG